MERNSKGRFIKGIIPHNKTNIKKECLTCGKEFKVKFSHFERRKTCSRKCAGKYRGSKPSPIKGRIRTSKIVSCFICGEKYLSFISKIKMSKKKFCSRKCLSIYFSEIYKGENGSNWKGGITPFDKQQRRLFRQTILKSILERDDYTCQICGQRGGNLQVDHIQSWAEYVELRFNMDNCRTLCMGCHYKVTFGKPMPKNIKSFGRNLLRGGVLA